jgi:hypothetical protein
LFSTTRIPQTTGLMRSTGSVHYFLLFVVACAGSRGSSPQPSAPEPERPAPTPSGPVAESWAFDYQPGITSYRVTRSATIENQSDSTRAREITTNLTHETLTLERVGDTIQFAVVADTFTTTTQNLVGPAQAGGLPIRVSGLLLRDTLQLVSDTLAGQCSPSQSAIRSDVHNLLLPFPVKLERGMAWKDSVELAGCQAMVTTVAHTRRSFLVSGEKIYEGMPVIIVERNDTIQAHGEGAQQQHRLVLDVSGSGNVLYYLSPSSGRIVHAIVGQELNLAIAASGKVHNFRQSLKQEYSQIR